MKLFEILENFFCVFYFALGKDFPQTREILELDSRTSSTVDVPLFFFFIIIFSRNLRGKKDGNNLVAEEKRARRQRSN